MSQEAVAVSVLESLHLDTMEVEDSYTGPRMEGELTRFRKPIQLPAMSVKGMDLKKTDTILAGRFVQV